MEKYKIYRNFLRFILNHKFLYNTIGRTQWYNKEVKKTARWIIDHLGKWKEIKNVSNWIRTAQGNRIHNPQESRSQGRGLENGRVLWWFD